MIGEFIKLEEVDDIEKNETKKDIESNDLDIKMNLKDTLFQFQTMLRKNSLLKGESKLKIIIEILQPLVVIAVLFGILYIVMIIQPDYTEHPAIGLPYLVGRTYLLLFGTSNPNGLTEYQEAIIKYLQFQITFAQNRSDPETCMKFFKTKQEMDDFYHDPDNYRGVIGGLWFEGDPDLDFPPIDSSDIPSSSSFSSTSMSFSDNSNANEVVYNRTFRYSISVDSDFVNDNSKVKGTIMSDSQIYLRHGFTQIQTAVDQAILYVYSGFDIPIITTAQRFPNPYVKLWQKWIQGRQTILLNFGGVFLTASLFICYFGMITDLVMEKETKILEGMKMMGLNTLSYYLSYSVSSMYISIPSSIIIAIVLLSTQLIYTTPIVVVLFSFVLYTLTLLILSFILSKFFDRSKFAGLISFFIILVLSSFGILVTTQFNKSLQLLFSLISPIAFTILIHTITSRDITDIQDLNWNITVKESSIIGMLVFDIFLYLILLWYIDNIMTGQYGIKKPWYFPLSKSYWYKKFGITKTNNFSSLLLNNFIYDDEYIDENESIIHKNIDVEEKPENKSVKVSIRQLRKEYETGDGLRVAIDDLNLNMYDGQIHAFLGPNGSGKSTTIGCLTGLITPTQGHAIIDGYNTKTQMEEIRKIIGVCPQQDILWPTLTVLEHLEIYASLKGITDRKQATKEAKFMANEVGIGEKLNSPSSTLSGGQKRKLCLGIAFIGRSKVLFIDEATSGMDPLSRRGVWDFLLKYKKGRTIILTTHFMDEADFLGDRIAIISRGKLRCDGSSLFLKNKFGAGYLLTISKNSSKVDTDPIVAFVKSHIPHSSILSNAATEVSFRLPTSNIDVFSEFFQDLENNTERLNVLHYGISVTTIEEIFLSLSNEDHLIHRDNINDDQESIDSQLELKEELMRKAINTNSQGITVRQQMKGLLYKRFRTTMKDRRAFILSLLIPLIIVSTGVVLLKKMSSFNFFNGNTTPLPLNLTSLITPNIYLPYSVDGPMRPLIEEALDHHSSPGKAKYIEPDEMNQYLVENYKDNPGAFSFDSNSSGILAKVWYNREYLHVLPIYINLMSNSLLASRVGLGIEVTSEPFQHIRSKFEIISENTNIGGIIFFIILLLAAFALVAASFGGNISQERSDRVKRLLYISGCKKYVYWLSNLLWDYGIIMLLVLFTEFIMIGTNQQFKNNFILFFLTLFLTALSIVPLAYVISFKFQSHGKSTGSIFGILLGISLIYTVVNLIVRIFVIKNGDEKLQSFGDFLDVLFYITSPLYCLSNVIAVISGFPGIQRLGTIVITNHWALEYCGTPLLILTIHSIVWISWILLIDYVPELRGHYYKRFSKFPPISPTPPPDEDSDVSAERIRVENNPFELVSFKDLHQSFTNPIKGEPPLQAVYNSTLGIDRGTTFGLLGMNGAGKSTTLNILSGDLIPTSGTVQINGYNLMNDRSKALESMGMCPQFCALVGLLSAREQLWLYSRIKGIPEDQIHDTVEGFIHMMDLNKIGNSNVKGYSGGNKRKVSLSIACIANPSLVILDEPSCGVDAQVRRFMWKTISELGKNKVIIITTHSMEECEALCDRISIMKNGKFTCLGSIQHVKSKYGSGYSVDVKFKKEYAEIGVSIVLENLPPGSKLIDHHDLVGSFEVPNPIDNPIQLSKIFSAIQIDLHYLVDSYSVSQTSLEQVFLKLTGARTLNDYNETDPDKEEDEDNVLPYQIKMDRSYNKLSMSSNGLKMSLNRSLG
ncbi:ABC transporter A family protein [Tieghemostelium lacteum]|uniref:ABC transporter A family protein n=1 Tax=Tieghemostelium lacteum TaxID=361077 RepID=A0A152A606_TIELA|nr:ABC transporter A family protein [Tieghemostelium lacteum]|eukprot:KYR01666.1 ABC transporter A family protein [Tieghemostelium lacteum]